MKTHRHLLILCLVAAMLPAGSLLAKGTFEWRDGQWVASAPPAEGTPEGELSLARQFYDDGRYSKVIKLAKRFADRYPDSEAYEEVAMLAGQAEMKRKRYYQAFEWFEKQLDVAPAGRFSDRTLQHEYDVADAFLSGAKRIVLGGLRLDATDEALEILQRIAEHAPGTDIAARSLMRIGDHHYEHGQWVEAAEAYDVLLKLMPNAAQAPEAMLRAAQATYASFEGMPYDETPLLDAEQRFETFRTSYPAAAHEADVAETLRRIVEARAEKAYVTARFYERVKRPSAAVFYYRHLQETFPQTQWASDAREALMRLGDIRPAGPASPLPTAPDEIER